MAFNLWRTLYNVGADLAKFIKGSEKSWENPHLTNRSSDMTNYWMFSQKRDMLPNTDLSLQAERIKSIIWSGYVSDEWIKEVQDIINKLPEIRDAQIWIDEENARRNYLNSVDEWILFWNNKNIPPERAVIKQWEEKKKTLSDILYWDLTDKQKNALKSYRESEMYLKIPEDWTEFFIDTQDGSWAWKKISIYDWYIYVTPLDTVNPRRNFIMDRRTRAYELTPERLKILQNWYDRKNAMRYINYMKQEAERKKQPTDNFVDIPIITNFDLWKRI